MILVQKTNGSQITFDNIRMFELAKSFEPGLQLINNNYKPEEKKIEIKEIKKEPKKVSIQVKTINPKPEIDIDSYTVVRFRKNIDKFNKRELNLFISKSKSKTIVKEAKNKLKKMA